MPRPASEPIGMMTTSVQVPLFPLEHRCKVCRLCHSDPDTFDALTRRLIRAEPRKQILAYLAAQGVHLTEKNLERHYKRHMAPFFRDALEIERRLRAEMLALDHEGSTSIASAVARSAAMRLLEALTKIDYDRLAKQADPALLREITNAARAVAEIDARAVDGRLKEKMVQLRALELDLKAGELDRVAARWILMRLRERPAIAQQVIQLLELPMPTEPMKALPSGNENTKHRTRAQRTRG